MSKKIQLERVDVETATKNFAKMLDNTQENFFVNGHWGAGKTNFLENVEKKSEKKFIYLDLWNRKDDRNVITIAYSKLHGVIYWSTLVLAIVIIAMSIIYSSKFVELIENITEGKTINLLNIVIVVALVSLAVWRATNFKKEAFYFFTIRYLLTRKKVLVVDDFDRLEPKVQEEAYKLFNILNGKISIIFLGDISKVTENRTINYLQKIIDSRVELPFALNPINIWDDYFLKLTETFGKVSGFSELKELFINEKRNLRDREQFNKLVNREFFDRNKYDHVQPYQQLLLIYAYLFYPNIYSKLLFNEHIEVSREYGKFINSNDDIKELGFIGEKVFEDLIYDMREDRRITYPRSFNQDRQAYYLYEEVSNLTVEDILNIIIDSDNLKKNLLSLGRDNDFYQYMLANYKNIPIEYKESLLGYTLYLARENYSTPVLNHIIIEANVVIKNEISKKMIEEYEENIQHGVYLTEEYIKSTEKESDKQNLNYWNNILRAKGFDISQRLYFFETFRIFGRSEIVELMKNETFKTENGYEKLRRKDFYIIYYLLVKKCSNNYQEWPSFVWEKIFELTVEDWLSFWINIGVLFPVDSVESNRVYPSATKYILRDELIATNKLPEVLIENLVKRKDDLDKKGYLLQINNGNRTRK